MMAEAHRYSSSHAILDHEATTTLNRSLYVQAVAWFLRGLPTNLTPHESLSLEAATPQSVIDARVPSATVPTWQDSSRPQPPSREPAFLHAVTAFLVFHILALAELVLPWIKMVVAHVYRLEKEHEITRRVVDTGIITANALGQRGVQLVQAVCRTQDGKVGEAINATVVRYAQGVAGGIRQGIEDRQRSKKRRELVDRER
jgi:hypothetical protein